MKQRYMGLAWGTALLGVLWTPAAAIAQTQADSRPESPAPAAASGVLSYASDFFVGANATTAADMVRRIPGFVLIDTDQSVRGLAGATGNVLIDGQLPSVKSVRLSQYLQRIPAGNVQRIDLIRGGAPGIDMQGQPVVVNIIRRGGSFATQAVSVLGKVFDDGDVGGVLRYEASRNWDASSLDGTLSVRSDKSMMDAGEGPFVLRGADGFVAESGDYVADYRMDSIDLSASSEIQRGAGQLQLNASADLDRNSRRDVYDLAITPVGPLRETAVNESEGRGGEVSVAYRRPLWTNWDAESLLIHTYSHTDQNSETNNRRPAELSHQTSTAHETILRGTLSWQASQAFKLAFNAEGAFNSLDVGSARSSGGTPVILPVANVLVEEQRAEAGVVASLALGNSVDVEASARFETSTISLSGDAEQEKTLSFFKPRVLVGWDVLASTQLRLRLEREVGQLNFNDFAASTDVTQGTVSAGNPELEPETADVAEVVVEQRFWGRGAATLTLRHEAVQQVVDLIPIGRQFDAPGNIGDGTRDLVSLTLNLPLDRIGVSGGLLRLSGTRRWSSVQDPVTGAERRISGERSSEGNLTLSRDVPGWRSTFSLEGELPWTQTAYRLRQIQTIEQDGSWKAYWDWNPRPDIALRFQIENFTSRERVRTRTLYSGTRDASSIASIERRVARLGPLFFVRLRKTF